MDRYKQRGDEVRNQNISDQVIDQAIDLTSLQFDSNLMGSLRQQIRQQITAVSGGPPNKKKVNLLPDIVDDIVGEIISSPECNKALLAPLLVKLFEQCRAVYELADIPKPLRSRRYICATGLVISPDHCTETIKDTARIHAFIHGIDKALRQLHDRRSGKVHIVYPACGPFAPLLLPLLSYYKRNGVYASDDIGVSLIDIQEGATRSLQALVNALDLQDFIVDISCCNAMEYQSSLPVHMVVLEALQHGFSREGHLQLAKYFSDMLEPDGFFIPKEIVVSAALNVGQREYVDQWKKGDRDDEHKQESQIDIRRERTELGEILRVNLPMLRNMTVQIQDEHTQLLVCGAVTIPHIENNHDKQVLLICSKVRVFDEAVIDEYASGITHPLPDMQVCINFVPNDTRPDDLLVNSGDCIKFYYCMNGLPGFIPLKMEDEHVQYVAENQQVPLECTTHD